LLDDSNNGSITIEYDMGFSETSTFIAPITPNFEKVYITLATPEYIESLPPEERYNSENGYEYGRYVETSADEMYVRFSTGETGPVATDNVGGNFILDQRNWYKIPKPRIDNLSGETAEIVYAYVPFQVSVYNKDLQGIADDKLRYPGIYFFSVEAKRRWPDDRVIESTPISGLSDYDSITLDDFSGLTAPVPSLSITRAGRTDMDVTYSISTSAIRNYIALRYDFDPVVNVNLYIGQYESAVEGTFFQTVVPDDDPDNDVPLNLTLPEREGRSYAFPYNGTPNEDGSRAVIDLKSDPMVLATLRGQNSTDGAAGAVPSGVVRIDKIPLPTSSISYIPSNPPLSHADSKTLITEARETLTVNLTLNNLDENQQYYLFADMTINEFIPAGSVNDPAYAAVKGPNEEFMDNTVSPPVPRRETSVLSGIEVDITDGTDNVPQPSENIPPAPQDIVAENLEGQEQTAARVHWARAAEAEAEGEVRIEYEVIRVQSEQIPLAALSSVNDEYIDLKAFFDTIGTSQKVAWVTEGNRATKYDHNFSQTDVSDSAYTTYNSAVERPTLVDYTLAPNNIYFYYVRTVKYVTVTDPTGQIPVPYQRKLVSTWVGDSVTTWPVQPPINLRIERGDEFIYDRMTEIMFSWDYILKNASEVGTAYQFQYQLREEGGNWPEPVTLNLSQLKITPNGDGTFHFVYKISSSLGVLKENTRYELHIRAHDMIQDDYSIYTGIVLFTTEFDKQKFEDEQNINKWLDYLKELLEKYLTDPYWIATSNANELVVIMRPAELFNGPLYNTSDSLINLFNSGQDRLTYYIPSSVIKTANSANQGFRLPYSDLDILLMHSALNEAYNDALIQMLNSMHRNEVSDYFVRLTVQRSLLDGEIENMPVLSKQTAVSLEAVGTVMTYRDSTFREVDFRNIETWDDRIFEEAAKIVAAKLNDETVKARILAEVKLGRLTEEMMAFVEGLADDSRTQIINHINNQLNQGTLLSPAVTPMAITSFSNPMYIVSKPVTEGTYADGFKAENGMWVPQPTVENFNGYAFSTLTPGTFVFAGRTVNIPGIEDVPRGGHISAFTAKYGLEDYLGDDGVDLTRNATRLMVAGSVARIAGAPETADPIAWISSNLNMRPASRGATGLVQTQEAVAMVMALYEQKTGTSVEDMTIRNYQITAGMVGLDDRYAQAVRAAYEAGILTDTEMRPATPVTIRTLLDMLGALNGKVKL
jgi:hypothetical protein